MYVLCFMFMYGRMSAAADDDTNKVHKNTMQWC